jgi:hypothetical protein
MFAGSSSARPHYRRATIVSPLTDVRMWLRRRLPEPGGGVLLLCRYGPKGIVGGEWLPTARVAVPGPERRACGPIEPRE